jgi:hypothetical protein
MDRYCEDCPTCPGKCLELKACVQCKQFKSGELHDQKVSFSSVPDPNPDLPDPHVFGPPGSGSFYHQAKIVRKNLIPTVL